jgi:hypothetical protein
MAEDYKGGLPAIVVDNIPSMIRHDAMPTAYLHRHALSDTASVNEYTRLVPRDACLAVIPEIERCLVPLDREVATAKARILLGCYPPSQTDRLENQNVYIRGIIAVFQEVPRDIADQAIDYISSEVKWLPTRAEVTQVCRRMLNERKRMLNNAKAHLAEHDRRALAKPPAKSYSDLTDEEKAAHDDRMRLFRETIANLSAGMRTAHAEPNERLRERILSETGERQSDDEDAA